MKNSTSFSGWLIVLCSLLFFAQNTLATVPVHAVDQSPGELPALLRQALDKEGYLGQFRNGQDLQRGLSAYLWDNRSWFQSVDFHNSRKFDAVVCLLQKKGYAGFDVYLKSELVKKWCNSLVQQP